MSNPSIFIEPDIDPDDYACSEFGLQDEDGNFPDEE